MEMHEVYNPSPEKNAGHAVGQRVAFGAAEVIVKTAIEFAKDVMPDSFKPNRPAAQRTEHTMVVVENDKQIAAVRAELNTLRNVSANQSEAVMHQLNA